MRLTLIIVNGMSLALAVLSVQADQFKAYEDLRRFERKLTHPAPPSESSTREERRRKREETSAEIRRLGFEYLEKYPDAAQRWDVVLLMVQFGGLFPPAGPRSGQQSSNTTPSRLEWTGRLETLKEALLASPDAREDLKARVRYENIFADLQEVARHGGAKSWSVLRDAVFEFQQRHPDSELNDSVWRSYIQEFARKFPPDLVRSERLRFAESPSEIVRRSVARNIAVHDLSTRPVSLQFETLDGRRIDLDELRGKVVLLDFWATWCAPCIAQMPHLRELYQKYHAVGFEIIGVTLDLPRDRARVKNFLEKNGYAWPQHFAAEDNNRVIEIFGVEAVPATFLLDASGMLVASGLKDMQLESEVQRLLSQNSNSSSSRK